ncbi:MAG: TIR domain-containing protein [bacterium]|nr:TIR domain-containing protein [bacterium]
MKYQAFISYKHSGFSRPKVIAVENALKKYARFWWKPRSIKIFRDEKEMTPGSNLGASINNALENSEYLIYFASREAAQSEWVQKELLKWCGELNRSDKLIIIQIADTIVTDPKEEKIVWEKTDALPSLLKPYIAYIPYFEDLRWSSRDELLDLENIRFREIINRITAQFRGKTPAEMNDENVMIDRRNKRIKKITIGVIAVLFITAILLAWYAMDQKNRADEKYKEALCSRLVSEAELVLPKDHSKAIRIAEAAYKIGFPSPPAPVVRALCSSAYLSRGRPFYSSSLSHEGVVRSAVFSPDGSRVLTASLDKTAKLWDSEGKLLVELKGYNGPVFSAVFSPDGSRVLTASSDGTAKLWDIKGKLLVELKGHTDSVRSAMFSPDGKYIVTASSDGTAIIWPTLETIMEYLETASIAKLTAEEKKELGIEGFNID